MLRDEKFNKMLDSYFKGEITKAEMIRLIGFFKSDVERAKKEIIEELKMQNVPLYLFENINNHAIKIFDSALKKAYEDGLENRKILHYVYNNVKSDLAKLVEKKASTL